MKTELSEAIQFYVPMLPDFRVIPSKTEEVWPWICNHPATPSGRTVWTIYTCLVLSEEGFNCYITREFPSGGVVISHRDFLPATLRPNPDVFLICIKPDRKPHSWAQMHIVQNPTDPEALRNPASTSWLPYWPQPSLIPRDPERGTHIENLAYIGRPLNLDPELNSPDWCSRVRSMGYKWQRIPMKSWHDYSRIDVTVSIRRFGDAHLGGGATMSSDSKPPSKLINSWLAGVPAIVSDESSFRAVQKSELDFLVANSSAELVEMIKKLADNPSLYLNMIENGRMRSSEFALSSIASRWESALEYGPHIHKEWIAQPRYRRTMENWRRYLSYWLRLDNIATAACGMLRK